MSTAIRDPTDGAATQVLVTVTSATRRVDLALPGAIPVAELLPELARSVGLLDGRALHGGYRLVTHDGRTLTTGLGLTVQGVEDGAFISVTAGAQEGLPRVYDDIVEVMADVVARDSESRTDPPRPPAVLGSALVLLLTGAAALLTQRGSLVAAGAAVAVALSLLLAAVTCSRLREESVAPVPAALAGCGYAAVAGLVLAAPTSTPGTSLAAAGGGLLVAGVLAALGLAAGRAFLMSPALVGVVLVSSGLVSRATTLDPAVVLTVALAGAVLAGSAFPGLALAATGTGVPPLFTPADLTRDAAAIDPARVSDDALLARQLMVAMSASVGILLVVVAPEAVSLGLAGTLVAVLAGVVAALRTRQGHSSADAWVGLASGLLGLASTMASVLWMHPDWRLPAALTLVPAGVVLMVAGLVQTSGPRRSQRVGDVVESVALLAIVPVLVVATGVFASVQGWVG
jgi:type VII secretion integral membrane protein EccD